MPAKSKAQQKAAGMALAAKRGDIPASSLKGAAKGMSKMTAPQLRHFAKTKRKGLPNKVKKSKKEALEELRTLISEKVGIEAFNVLAEIDKNISKAVKDVYPSIKKEIDRQEEKRDQAGKETAELPQPKPSKSSSDIDDVQRIYKLIVKVLADSPADLQRLIGLINYIKDNPEQAKKAYPETKLDKPEIKKPKRSWMGASSWEPSEGETKTESFVFDHNYDIVEDDQPDILEYLVDAIKTTKPDEFLSRIDGKIASLEESKAQIPGEEDLINVTGRDEADLNAGGHVTRSPGGVSYVAKGPRPKKSKGDPTKPLPRSPLDNIVSKYTAKESLENKTDSMTEDGPAGSKCRICGEKVEKSNGGCGTPDCPNAKGKKQPKDVKEDAPRRGPRSDIIGYTSDFGGAGMPKEPYVGTPKEKKDTLKQALQARGIKYSVRVDNNPAGGWEPEEYYQIDMKRRGRPDIGKSWVTNAKSEIQIVDNYYYVYLADGRSIETSNPEHAIDVATGVASESKNKLLKIVTESCKGRLAQKISKILKNQGM